MGAPRRFPLENAGTVRRQIAALLAGQAVGALVSSAACGADLLAIEAARAAGIPAHPVLPFGKERFRQTSVTDRPGDWGPLFDSVIAEAEAAERLEVLGFAEEDESAYEATNHAILSRAAALASSRGDQVTAAVVWDGQPRDGQDLTEAFRKEAVHRGMRLVEIRTV